MKTPFVGQLPPALPAPAAAAAPAPTKEEVLLSEIRDLLKEQNNRV